MRQLYGGVPNFNFEEEYGIIARTIAHERDVLQEAPKFVHVVQGINLVSPSTLFVVWAT
jgi:SP family general alpha glucoside:H+ symporter-like MFS transporter